MEDIIQKLKEEGVNYKKVKYEGGEEKECLYTKEAFFNLPIKVTGDKLSILNFKKTGSNIDGRSFSIQKLKENNKDWDTFIEYIRSYKELQL